MAAMAVVACLGGGPRVAGADGSADWPAYLMDASHSSYNGAATAITPANVSALTPVWRWLDPNQGGIQATPVTSAGVVYVGDAAGYLYAIRESDQSVLWSRFLGHVVKTTCAAGGTIATPTVAADPASGRPAVYENGQDGNLYALDAATGSVLWTARVDTPSTTVNDYFAWSSPLVANGKVYVGVTSSCDQPLVHGGLMAFDQRTGGRPVFFRSNLNGSLGGDVWSTAVALPDGSVVVTTGNGADDVPQVDWSDSVVRLDGAALGVLDGWQVPATQREVDSDFGGSPTLFTAVLNGSSTPMVGACNKNGFFYALRQSDLHDGPVWQFDLGPSGTYGNDRCFAAAIWDGTNLLLSAATPAGVGTHTFQGSVTSVDPSTGAIRWQTGLAGAIVGTPTEDGAGVVAAPVYWSTTGTYGVYLLNAGTGAILGRIQLPDPEFAQPVFTGSLLLVADDSSVGLTAYAVPSSGPPLTSSSPAAVTSGQTQTVVIGGAGFSGNPSVFVSGVGVAASAVQVIDPTQLSVTLTASSTAKLGPRDLSVVEPGPVVDACSACLAVVAPTATTVASSTNPTFVSQSATFTATVTPTDGSGTVAFTSDGSPIPACTSRALSGSGPTRTATCTTATLTAGSHAIAASYSGDAHYGASSGTLPGGQVVNTPPPVPTPTGVKVTVASISSLAVHWNAVAGATRYLVYRSSASGGPYVLAATLASSATAATIGSLPPATTEYFVVRAGSLYALSPNSAEASARTPAIPAAPSNLRFTDTANTTVTLAWSAVTGATQYIVERSRTSGGPYTAVIYVASSIQRLAVGGLTAHTKYFFVVYATNGYATSPASHEVSATTG